MVPKDSRAIYRIVSKFQEFVRAFRAEKKATCPLSADHEHDVTIGLFIGARAARIFSQIPLEDERVHSTSIRCRALQRGPAAGNGKSLVSLLL